MPHLQWLRAMFIKQCQLVIMGIFGLGTRARGVILWGAAQAEHEGWRQSSIRTRNVNNDELMEWAALKKGQPNYNGYCHFHQVLYKRNRKAKKRIVKKFEGNKLYWPGMNLTIRHWSSITTSVKKTNVKLFTFFSP